MTDQQRRDLPTLPDELIRSDILPRLPALDLVRFKLVCKPWLTTISDPEFHKSHLTHQTPGRIESHQSALLYTNPEETQTLVLLSLAYLPNPQPPFPTITSLFSPITSCNGLLVGHVKDVWYYITNPVTRRYKELPPPPDLVQHCFLHFDDASDLYTLFAWTFWDQQLYLLEFKTQLAWRKLNPHRHWHIDLWPPVAVTGCLYWTVDRWMTDPDPVFERAILAMDTKTKEFREIQVPVPIGVDAYDLGMVYRLTLTEGFLYLIKKHESNSNVRDKRCHVIWRLENEEGPMWTKIYQHFEDHCTECNRRFLEDSNSLVDSNSVCTHAEAKKIRDSCQCLYKSALDLYDSVPHTNSLICFCFSSIELPVHLSNVHQYNVQHISCNQQPAFNS